MQIQPFRNEDVKKIYEETLRIFNVLGVKNKVGIQLCLTFELDDTDRALIIKKYRFGLFSYEIVCSRTQIGWKFGIYNGKHQYRTVKTHALSRTGVNVGDLISIHKSKYPDVLTTVAEFLGNYEEGNLK